MKFIYRAFWVLLIGLSIYYLYRGIRFRFFEEGIGDTLWNKQFWFVFHLASAVAPLALGPFQFWPWFRKNFSAWHRRLGRAYLIGSLLGGFSALYLGLTQPYQGSIVPVVLLAILWLFMTSAAWITIRKRNIPAHRLFVIRGYVLALTFVSLRLLGDLVDQFNILFFIDNPEVKDTTYEWLSWVLPLVITEFMISWIPLLKGQKGKGVIAKTVKTHEYV
jgi:uncharacterized membrane protein